MGNNNNNRNNSNNNRSNNNNGNNNRNNQTSRTGCKSGVGKEGKPWISGYNFWRGWTFVAGPYEGSHVTESRNGIEWENWVAWFTVDGMPKDKGVSCLFNLRTGCLHFPKLGGGMIAKPAGKTRAKDGYFGRVKSK